MLCGVRRYEPHRVDHDVDEDGDGEQPGHPRFAARASMTSLPREAARTRALRPARSCRREEPARRARHERRIGVVPHVAHAAAPAPAAMARTARHAGSGRDRRCNRKTEPDRGETASIVARASSGSPKSARPLRASRREGRCLPSPCFFVGVTTRRTPQAPRASPSGWGRSALFGGGRGALGDRCATGALTGGSDQTHCVSTRNRFCAWGSDMTSGDTQTATWKKPLAWTPAAFQDGEVPADDAVLPLSR